MTKEEVLQQINELIDLQEKAIQDHPPETSSVYLKGRDAFITGQSTADETDWSRSMSLSLDELSLMHRYMLSSSFISAWYHLSGEKAQRDKAAQSCSTLIAGLGPKPEDVMRRYIEYEQLWRRTMKSEGVAPRRISIFWIIVIAVILSVILKFFMSG